MTTIDAAYALHIKDTNANLLKIERTTTANAVMSFANTTKEWFFGSSNSGGDYTIGTGLDLTHNRVLSIKNTTYNVGIGFAENTDSIDEKLHVNGSIKAADSIIAESGSFSDELLVSGSTNLYNSGSTVLDIQGSQGQLFSVSDEEDDVLFAVSDISGQPILEVNISGSVNVNGALIPELDVPTSISGSGTKGEIRTDTTHIYVCTATDTWKRVAISTW